MDQKINYFSKKIKQDNKLLTAVKATEAYAELEEEIKKAAE
jgi:predicted  nucleic acid-binding Zn-ribbon protein